MIVKRAAIPEIVQHHLEEAGFLWQLRQRAVLSAEYTLDDLAGLDERLEAHLEGLLNVVEDGWQLSADALEEHGPGAVFAATWLWLKQGAADRAIALVEQTAPEPQFYSALSAAFGRVTPASLQGIVRTLLVSPSTKIKQLGIEACVSHGVHPGRFLASFLADQDAALCVCAIESCAALGLTEYITAIASLLSHDDTEVRVAAAGGLLLLGDRGDALDVLSGLVEAPAFAEDAALVMVCAVSVTQASELLKELAARAKGISLLIKTVAGNGDPYYVPWLLREMQKPLVARLTGHAFETITGVDIQRVARAKAPDSQPSAPTDDPAVHSVAIDGQTDLQWPDAAKLNQWWGQNQHRWEVGARYLLGQPLSPAACIETLKRGNQRHRALACRLLCLMNPGTPVFNIHAPAWRQKQKLSAMC
jgi:uncharacterized protein (TIGR02270 family)